MDVVALLRLFLSVAGYIAKYISDKQLMEAGVAQATLEGIENAKNAIARANAARANVDSVPVDADPNNRDNG